MMRTKSARSRATLISAAKAVISRHGLHELTMRDVALTASMSPGSVLYHYRNRDDLVFEVHQDAVASYIASRSAVALGRLDPRERLLAMMLSGIPPLADSDAIVLLFELHGLARRSAAHAALMTQLWDAEVGLYRDVIVDGIRTGVFHTDDKPGVIATQLLALEDGLGLHVVSGNRSLETSVVVNAWRLAAAALLGCPALADLEIERLHGAS